MTDNLHIVWKGLEPSEALRSHIAGHVEALGIDDTCRVVVDHPHHQRRHGRRFEVKLELGRHTVSHAGHDTGEDAFATVSSAFAKLDRQLTDENQQLRAVHRRAPRRA
ncbi:MAG: HPF/RaiA family ribosome-associated protein [Myxococcaceae bacterium]|nr:HPF/RaiA family ribosome-associated protein [Myxococcaceae bacterium]